MGTVTISGSDFTIYGTLTGANTYLLASPRWYAAWEDLDTNARGRALVEATRKLDALRWQGVVTTTGQEHAWPRTGVVDADGTTVGDNVVPSKIEQATYVLAAIVADDPEALDEDARVQGNLKRAKAGPVEVEYHERLRPEDLPSNVLAMVQEYMDSGLGRAGGIGGYSSGVEVAHSFDDDFGIGGASYVAEED